MKAKINATVWYIACDDDAGTQAILFPTQREAVECLVRDCLDVPLEKQQELIDLYFSDGDFYDAMQEYKSEMDTYSIDCQDMPLEGELIEPLEFVEGGQGAIK